MSFAVSQERKQSACLSILPIFVTDGEAVEKIAVLGPLREMMIHERQETCVVGRFEQMHQLMHNDVFQALPGFPCQIGV